MKKRNLIITLSVVAVVAVAVVVIVTLPSLPLQDWSRVYSGSPDVSPSGVAVDAAENIYISAVENDTTVILIKYNSDGDPPTTSTPYITSYLIREPSEPILNYASDFTYINLTCGLGSGSTFDKYLTLKYRSDLSLKWDSLLPRLSPSDLHGPRLEVDEAGNVLVTGSNCESVGMNSKITALKYSNIDGSGMSSFSFTLNPNCYAFGNSILYFNSTNGYIFGSGAPSSPGITDSNREHLDYITINYNPLNGIITQVDVYDGGGSDRAMSLLPVGDGLYVTGTTTDNHTGDSWIVTYKYSFDLSVRSAPVIYNNPEGVGLDAVGKILHYNNHIFLLGESHSPVTGRDIILIKYDLNLSEIAGSPARYDHSQEFDQPSNFLVSPSGDIYIVGKSGGTQGDDIVLLKYNSDLELLKEIRHDIGGFDQGVDLAFSPDEKHLYVVGYSEISGDRDIVLIKYLLTP